MDFSFINEIGSRFTNEDSCSIKENNGRFCFTVCDGLGGHAKGEIASKAVADTFAVCYESYEDHGPFFEKAFSESASALTKLANEKPMLMTMKTTVVTLNIYDNKCRWAHIGDSRLYGFKGNSFTLCTSDHSVPEMLVKSGRIKPSDIRNHPDRNKLLRALGVDESIVDFEQSEEHNLDEFDAFLLCTDGFWELINERKMIRCLHHSSSANEWLSLMTKAVKHKGKRRNMDNFTAIAIIINKGGIQA